MKKIYSLFALMCLSLFGFSQSQVCEKKYISNGDVENFNGSGSDYTASTLPGWHRYSGTPKVSGANAPTSPLGQSILLREELPQGSSSGTYNTLYNQVNGGDYILEFYVKATANKSDGAIDIFLTNGLSGTAAGIYLDPTTVFTNLSFDPNSRHVKTVNSSTWGNQQNWVKVTIPFNVPTNSPSFSQLLILPKKNSPSTSPRLEIRIDAISLRNQNTLTGYAYTLTNQKCLSTCDGRIVAYAGAGTPPYTYTVMPGNITGTLSTPSGIPGGYITHKSVISNLCPGNYTITITDQNQCTRTSQATINTSSCPINMYTYLSDNYTGGATFSGNYYADKDVHLRDGTYYLKSGTVWEMMSCNITYDVEGSPDPTSYRKIYVHSDATLILEEATITGFCDNAWYGIEFEDNSTELLIHPKSKIEHAYKAISGEANKVYINGAHFENNLYAISEFKVTENTIQNSRFSSNSYQLPFPYNDGTQIMQKAIQLESKDQSIINENRIDNVAHAIDIWVSGSSSLTKNELTNIRKIGMSVYNLNSMQALVDNNTIELNATYFQPVPTNEVIGIYQLHSTLPNLAQINVKFLSNTIKRTTGTVGKDLVGISEVAFGNLHRTYYEKNRIELEKTFSGKSYAFRSKRDGVGGLLHFYKNEVINNDVGMQLGNGSGYSDINYSIRCNTFMSLDWGIETIPLSASGIGTDVTRLMIGRSYAASGNTWKFIPTTHFLKNNSPYKLYYYRVSDESIDNPNCYIYSALRYNVIGNSQTLNGLCN